MTGRWLSSWKAGEAGPLLFYHHLTAPAPHPEDGAPPGLVKAAQHGFRGWDEGRGPAAQKPRLLLGKEWGGGLWGFGGDSPSTLSSSSHASSPALLEASQRYVPASEVRMAMKWTEPSGPPPRRATPSLDQVSWGSGLPSATQFRSRASPTSAFRTRGPCCTWGGTDRATGRGVKAGAPGGGSHRA